MIGVVSKCWIIAIASLASAGAAEAPNQSAAAAAGEPAPDAEFEDRPGQYPERAHEGQIIELVRAELADTLELAEVPIHATITFADLNGDGRRERSPISTAGVGVAFAAPAGAISTCSHRQARPIGWSATCSAIPRCALCRRGATGGGT